MPKIIFRPNPTPPPFVPPTPSYDTHYYAQSLRQTYDLENSIELKFNPCSYPECKYIEIHSGDERVALLYDETLSTDDFQPWETESSGSIPFQGHIKFFKVDPMSGEIMLHSAPIEVTFAG